MYIHVSLNERVFVHINEQPERYLGPGRHSLFAPFRKVELVRVNTDLLIADLRPEQAALVPAEDLMLVSLGKDERALVSRRGRPVRWLGAGEHQIWIVEKRRIKGGELEPVVSIERFDVSGVATAPLREDVRVLVPAGDYIETTATEGAVAIRYLDGALDEVLPPGRHAAWTARRKVNFAVIDLRERMLHVTGQEVMTKDRVSLRLNLSAAYKVIDPKRLATVAREPDEVLYLAIQLAAREAVSTKSLDELLLAREAVGGAIAPAVAERAAVVGLEVLSFGVKDLILPGEMKALLNRVIEAQKEAEANVIFRREETAAARSMAQTAKVLVENPMVMRLKELEAYKELAAKVGQVHLVLGDGVMSKLELGISGNNGK